MSILLGCWLWLVAQSAPAQAPRFVMDDDAFLDRIALTAAKLVKQQKLVPLDRLKRQLERSREVTLAPVPLSREKFSPPDLYDRVRESTFAVGPFYRCADCEEWHFTGGTGFAVGEDGVISTCCHILNAEEEEMKDAYLIAVDSTGRVFPVRRVLAADKESDTCFLKIDATGLKPLPFRPGVRTGEPVFCLSHPGGNHFMFAQGMVARVMKNRDTTVDAAGKTNVTRPILYLNITAEYAPGSSGAPVVDESGNVVGQVTSIADAGEPLPEDPSQTAPASPSVPVRFCLAAEEIVRLVKPPSAPAEARKTTLDREAGK
ncbi:MAG: trypsin-like peptidase domain-containing protein [Verrucomicrobia bacterium]|nr:trypsin-like peptidase domain-containing protein [Verrucomicrobiota bacterium]